MTLIEISFALQRPPTTEQLRRLGDFANTYGLRSFLLDPDGRRLNLVYDASRLKRTEVASVLRLAGLAVTEPGDAAAA